MNVVNFYKPNLHLKDSPQDSSKEKNLKEIFSRFHKNLIFDMLKKL